MRFCFILNPSTRTEWLLHLHVEICLSCSNTPSALCFPRRCQLSVVDALTILILIAIIILVFAIALYSQLFSTLSLIPW